MAATIKWFIWIITIRLVMPADKVLLQCSIFANNSVLWGGPQESNGLYNYEVSRPSPSWGHLTRAAEKLHISQPR